MTSNERLHLEDLQVGQRYVSGSQLIDAEQIIAFAKQFDPQPFHLDPEAAKDSLFKGHVASGWHTAAVTMRLLVTDGLPIAGGLIGASVEVNWPKPTKPGSELHVESEVVDIKRSRSRPDRGIVTVRSETRDQSGEVLQVLIAKMVVPSKSAASDPPGGH